MTDQEKEITLFYKDKVWFLHAPAYWASYLINGDNSGLEEFEIAQADQWMHLNDISHIYDCSENSNFQDFDDCLTECLVYTCEK